MTRGQSRLFWGCLAAYLIAYTGRLNLAAALPVVVASLELSGAQAGLLQTAFAVVYACGQLLNGLVVDRVSARGYVAVGLLGSAACNIAVSLCASYGQMLCLWALNGAFQSMLWTPIMRLLSLWFAPGKPLRRACVGMAFAPILGNLLAWALSGTAANGAGWHWAFRLPGVLLALACAVAWRLIPKGRPGAAAQGERPGAAEGPAMSVGALIARTGFIGVLLCCVAAGFMRDGVIVWTPTIIAGQAGGALSKVALTLLIPLINLVSILIGSILMRAYEGRPRKVIAWMMALACAMSALLAVLWSHGALACAVLMGVVCMLLYGLNPLLVSLVPMEYAPVGRVGMTAGMIDSFIYLGSGLAGAVGGWIQGTAGEQALFFAWVAAGVVGALSMLYASRRAVVASQRYGGNG